MPADTGAARFPKKINFAPTSLKKIIPTGHVGLAKPPLVLFNVFFFSFFCIRSLLLPPPKPRGNFGRRLPTPPGGGWAFGGGFPPFSHAQAHAIRLISSLPSSHKVFAHCLPFKTAFFRRIESQPLARFSNTTVVVVTMFRAIFSLCVGVYVVVPFLQSLAGCVMLCILSHFVAFGRIFLLASCLPRWYAPVMGRSNSY